MNNCLLGLYLLSCWLEQATPARLSFVRDLRIGSIDRPNYALTYVSGLAISATGTICIAQPRENVIRVYDNRGRFVRTIGRRGRGPGEFSSVDRIGWRADTLWITDIALQHVNFFSREGKFLNAIRVTGPMRQLSARPTPVHAVLGDGSLLGVPATGENRRISNLPLVRLDRNGRHMMDLAHIDIGGSMGVIKTGHSIINFYYPVRSEDIWNVAPDGRTIVVVTRDIPRSASESTFRVTRIDLNGDTVFSRSFRYQPVRTPEHVRDSLVNSIAEFFMQGRISRAQALKFAADSAGIPEYQPPVTHAFIGADHSVWIGREQLGRSTTEWWLLDQRGNLHARGLLPSNFKGLHADRAHIWGVESDEWGVSYVARYRIKNGRATGNR